MVKRKTDILTIAIPVCNRTDYFKEAIDSIFAQTIIPEILVVDNASDTDFFQKVCRDSNIRYIRNQHNIGMFGNWNKCISESRTEYVMILGDDDTMEQHFVEAFLNTNQKYPVDLYFTNFKFMLQRNDRVDMYNNKSFKVPYGYTDGYIFIDYAIKHGIGFPTIAAIYRRSIFTGFYTKFHASNDWLWVYRHIDSCKVYGLDEYLVNYRKHIKADTNNVSVSMACLLSRAYIYEEVLGRKTNKIAMKLLARLRAICILVRLPLIDEINFITSMKHKDHIYSDYLARKIKKSIVLRLLYGLPKSLKILPKRMFRILKSFNHNHNEQ